MTTFERTAWILGFVGLVAAAVGAVIEPARAAIAYLWAYWFWLGLGLGAVSLLALHALVGGLWGVILRPFWTAAARSLPVLALFALPIVPMWPFVFAWSASSAHLAGYLSPTFLYLRWAIMLLAWCVLGHLLADTSDRLNEAPTAELARTFEARGAAWWIVYSLTITLAATDLIAGPERGWSASILGMLMAGTQLDGAFALTLLVFLPLALRPPFAHTQHLPLRFQDMGNLLLTFSLVWGYLAFSQFLITWAGNVPMQVVWFAHRLAGGWSRVAEAFVFCILALPLATLLFVPVKRHPWGLGSVSAAAFVGLALHGLWLVLPAFQVNGPALHGLDLAAWAGVGGVWLAVTARLLRRAPRLLAADPRVNPGAAHA